MAEAYETLIDPDSREAYDRYGEDAGPGMGGMDPDDLFAELFGGGMRFNMGGGMGPGSRKPGGKNRKGESSVSDYSVTLEDLYNGKSAHFAIEKGVVCGTCKG